MSARIRHLARWLPQSSYWRDISWVASGTALAQAIGLLTMPVLTRLYTPADFATLNIFAQAVAFACVVMTLRFEYAIQLPRATLGAQAVLRLVLVLALLGVTVLTPAAWALSPVLARWAGQPMLEAGLSLVPVTAGLLSVSLAVQHLAQRERRYRRSGGAEVMGKLAYFATAIAGHWWLPGALGLIGAVGAGAIAKIFALVRTDAAAARGHGLRLRPWRRLIMRAARRYRGLSTSMVSSHLMFALTGLVPTLYLTHAFGADALGQYALVLSTNYLPSALIGTAIGQVYYQRAAEHWSHGNGFVDLWRSTTRRLAMLGIPLYAGLALLSPWLYPLVFGAQWKQAGIFSAILCLSSFLSFLTAPLDRSCLIVGAWHYVPLWHLGRLLSTVAVVGLAWRAGWSETGFMIALTLQMSTSYLVDFFAERHFASRRPVTSVLPPITAQ